MNAAPELPCREGQTARAEAGELELELELELSRACSVLRIILPFLAWLPNRPVNFKCSEKTAVAPGLERSYTGTPTSLLFSTPYFFGVRCDASCTYAVTELETAPPLQPRPWPKQREDLAQPGERKT